MTRKDALVVIKVAGYHADTKTFVRTYTENRLSYAVAKKAFDEGARLQRAGLPCSCYACAKALS